MTVTAPPRPPRPGDPVDRDELEALVRALIEEARRRARRRRLMYAAVAATVALAGVAAFVVSDRAAQSQLNPAQPAARPSLGAAAAEAKIAFLSDVPKARLPKGVRWQGELYVMNPDGSGMRRLARFASAFPRPTWSPDGRMIAFERRLGPIGAPPPGNGQCRVCHWEIFVMNADGSGQRNLTGNAGGGFPVWSPDGQQIAFSRDNGFIPNLYVMNVDGSGQRRVTQDPIHVWGASWSPDGQRLTFSSGVQGNPGRWNIYVVNVDGSGQQQLTRDAGQDPAWSPDGQRIAFTSIRRNERPGRPRWLTLLHVVNADGSERRELARQSNSDASFSWSPDGQRIAFVSDRDGNDEVYVVNVDGGLRNLTRNPARDGHPVWSTDGRTVGFVSNRGGNRDIYVMNADGTRQRNLTRGLPQPAWGIAWSPA